MKINFKGGTNRIEKGRKDRMVWKKKEQRGEESNREKS
jgi:hypothetical protein